MKTFQNQNALPKLPLRTAEETLRKFVATAQPFLSEDRKKEVEALAEEAIADPTVAKAQVALERLVETEENWLDPLWIPNAYMKWRAALPINSNVSGYLHQSYTKKWDQAFAAAAVTEGALKYHVHLLNQEIAPNMMKDTPLCMDQYSRMFSLCRCPGIEEDHLVKFKEEESQHVVVLAGKRHYVFDVLDGREIVPLPRLLATFQAIQKEARKLGDADHPVSILTALDRTKWAQVRNRMVTQPKNGKALKAIESSIFAVSLEDGIDGSNQERGRSCLAGSEGQTSWFDKSFQLRVKEDGNPSICIEHSWAEAPVPLDMFYNHVLPHADALDEKETLDAAKGATPLEFQLLEFDIDQQLKKDIKEASIQVKQAIEDSDIEVFHCRGFGSKLWKNAGISADAAVQMAMQLAYRAHTGSRWPVATYETIGMVAFKHGRTETCRVVSNASENFVKTVMNGFMRTGSENDRAAAEEALRKACDAHTIYLKEGRKGFGIDRHLLGLRIMGATPKIFSDESFTQSGTTGAFVLSTSNNGYIPVNGLGLFGCVIPDGYGICYIPRSDEVILCIESKKSSEKTNSAKFAKDTTEALQIIARIVVPNFSVNSSKL